MIRGVVYLQFAENEVYESDEERQGIIIDFDVYGNIVGIEYLNASGALKSESLRTWKNVSNYFYINVVNSSSDMEKPTSYIEINPEIRFGKPIIKGTRIAISDILNRLASGMPHNEILDDYPMLEEVHIRAALAFAANREAFIKIIAA